MALGTITINSVKRFGNSSELLVDVSVVGDGAYPTGGTLLFEQTLLDALAAGSNPGPIVGNYELLSVEKIDGNVDADAHYVKATDALMVRDGDGVEKGNGTNQGGDTYRLLAKLV
jgi:hypothetical protein